MQHVAAAELTACTTLQVDAQLKRLTQLLNSSSNTGAMFKHIKPGTSKLAKKEQRAAARERAGKKPKAPKGLKKTSGGVHKPKNKDKYKKKKPAQ